jgi:hypothetical protein
LPLRRQVTLPSFPLFFLCRAFVCFCPIGWALLSLFFLPYWMGHVFCSRSDIELYRRIVSYSYVVPFEGGCWLTHGLLLMYVCSHLCPTCRPPGRRWPLMLNMSRARNAYANNITRPTLMHATCSILEYMFVCNLVSVRLLCLSQRWYIYPGLFSINHFIGWTKTLPHIRSYLSKGTLLNRL